MPKVGMEQQRRQELVEATLWVISQHGYGDATVSKIAKKAGLSVGIISHYFGGKDALLEASMWSLMCRLHRDVLVCRKAITDPRKRVYKTIDVLLGEEQCDASTISAWLSFWAQVPFNPRFHRLQKIYCRRVVSNLAADVKSIEPNCSRALVLSLSEALASLIDGLWLRSVLAGQEINKAPVINLLDSQLGSTS